MDAQTWYDLEGGRWAEVNPSCCPCRGTGWLVSDYDTYHRCPRHGAGAPHPESENHELSNFDYTAHTRRNNVAAYRYFRDLAMASGFRGDFKAACRREMNSDVANPTPQMWVDAAQDIAVKYASDKADQDAQRAGYSCALEMRWEEEAAEERRERRGW